MEVFKYVKYLCTFQPQKTAVPLLQIHSSYQIPSSLIIKSWMNALLITQKKQLEMAFASTGHVQELLQRSKMINKQHKR